MAQPVTRFQNGSVKISVWDNEGKKGHFRSIRVERGYKDPATGEWKNSSSFLASEVPALVSLLQRAHEFLDNPSEGEKPAYRQTQMAGAKGGNDDAIL